MIVYPAIDLRAGVCVRLLRGDFDAVTHYDADPLARSAAFEAEGASWVHVVDLDGAKAGEAVQHDLIGRIARSGNISVQAGGGVRSADDIRRLLDVGVQRVVVGSAAVTQPELVLSWLEAFTPERITVALDVIPREDRYVPALKGWTGESETDVWGALSKFAPGALTHVLVTDISRDGALTGPNLDLLGQVKTRRPDLAVQASGGVSSLEDLRAAKAIGCAGAIAGRAIYEARFTLAEALAV